MLRVVRRLRWHIKSTPAAYRRPVWVPARALSAVAEDDEVHQEAARVHAESWLGEIDEGQLAAHARMLCRLGVHRKRDLQFVREQDLVDAGIPLVASRRIMAAALPPPAEVSMMMRPQGTLNVAAEAGLVRGQRPSGVIVASGAIGGALLAFGGCMYALSLGPCSPHYRLPHPLCSGLPHRV